MKPTSTPLPALTPPADNLRVTALGVGHGDAILIQWQNNGEPWTCLVDGGLSPAKLQERLQANGVDRLNLLVLTHLDSDHIGGLEGLPQKIKIENYWGPALPAFKRHLWLFPPRAADSIARGERLEESLKKAHVSIHYPLEGYQSMPRGGDGIISVLSPASRLIRRLLTGKDVTELFTQHPMPLGWLLAPPAEPPEQSAAMMRLDAAFSRGVLDPERDFADLPPESAHQPAGLERMIQDWAAATNLEPEFFGDSVLNNTSLVLYFDIRTENRTHRLLLPGDQENWTYLLARNPRGLRADVLKASHHGGRVYLERDLAHDELFSSVQPKVVLVSAEGRHQLPRAVIRQSAVNWGASVACTCSRKAEYFTGTPEDKVCCHDLYQCGESHDISLVLDRDGLRSESPACHSGFGQKPGPVIQVRQHVVDPSPVLNNLSEHELRLHILWVKEILESIHQDRTIGKTGIEEGNEPVSVEHLAAIAREKGLSHLVPNLGVVLRHGMIRREFWAGTRDRYSDVITHAYASPRPKDIKTFLNMLAGKSMLIFPETVHPFIRDKKGIVDLLDLEGLASFANAVIYLPKEAFREALWPSVASAFKSDKWKCYLHPSQIVAFSTHKNSTELIKKILTTHLVANDSKTKWHLKIFYDELPYSSEVWIGPSRYGLDMELLNQWLRVEKSKCSSSHWQWLMSQDFDSIPAAYTSDAKLTCELFASHAKGDIAKIATYIEPMIYQIP